MKLANPSSTSKTLDSTASRVTNSTAKNAAKGIGCLNPGTLQRKKGQCVGRLLLSSQ